MLKKSYVSGNKLFTFIIISSIFSIILNEVLPDIYLLGFFLVLVLFFGIIHGANDIYLIINNTKNHKSISKMTIFYIITVLFITLCFFSLPSASLIFFILFSCYHFGEQQWTILDDKNHSNFFFFLYGLLIFSTLFFFNKDEVIEIVFMITKTSIKQEFFNWLLVTSFCLNLLISFLNFKKIKNQLINQIIMYQLIVILFYKLSLFNAFAIYFVFFHSIPSIFEQTKFLYGSYNFSYFKNYLFTAFPYWVFAIIGLFLFYLFFSDNLSFSLDIFFSFLAAITFPHVIVIYKMKKMSND